MRLRDETGTGSWRGTQFVTTAGIRSCMSIADSGLNRHLGEPNLVFERLCQTLCRQLAKAAAPTAHVVESMIYAHNYDGGTDAVVVMSSGHRVAIEAKAYATIEQEIQSITASFTRMLSVAEHTGVTHYLWCSTFKRNVSAVGRDIDDTIRCLEALSGTRGVTVKFVVACSR